MKNKVLEQYLKELEKALCCPHRERMALLSQGKSLLENFLEETPEADYEAFVTAFGPPEVFAGEMLDTLDRETLKQAWAGQKWLLRGVAALVAISLIAPAAFWFAGQREGKPDPIISVTPNVTPTESVEPNVTPNTNPSFNPGVESTDPDGSIYTYGILVSQEQLKRLETLIGSNQFNDLFGWDGVPAENDTP